MPKCDVFREGCDKKRHKSKKKISCATGTLRDCTGGCNNCVQTRSWMSAIDLTKKILFERLYLVSGMGTFGPWVNCPYAPTTPTVHYSTISRFLCNFFPRMAPHFFGRHDSPSNLAKSRYPRRRRNESEFCSVGCFSNSWGNRNREKLAPSLSVVLWEQGTGTGNP